MLSLLISLTLLSVGFGRTTLPPTTEPTTPKPPCVGDDGQWYFPGQTWSHDCTFCTCSVWGPDCYIADCLPAMCFDAHKSSSCCYTCPTGRNCVTPGGQVIHADPGHYVHTREGLRCTCPTDSPAFPYVRAPRDYTAICTPTTTGPPTTIPPTVVVGRRRSG